MEKLTVQFFPQVLLTELMLSFSHPRAPTVVRSGARTFRTLLAHHDFDGQYQSTKARQLAAVMYINFVPDLWQRLDILNDKLLIETKRDLLACFLYIIKNVSHRYFLNFLEQHKTRMLQHSGNSGQESPNTSPKVSSSSSTTPISAVKVSSASSTASKYPRETSDGTADERAVTSAWFAHLLDTLELVVRTFEYPGKRCEAIVASESQGKRRGAIAESTDERGGPNDTILCSEVVNQLANPQDAERDSSWDLIGSLGDVRDRRSTEKSDYMSYITGTLSCYERIFASEVSNVVLDVIERVIIPFFDRHLLTDLPTHSRLIQLMLTILSLRQSDKVTLRTLRVYTSALESYRRLLFAHGRAPTTKSDCENFWIEIFELGCHNNSDVCDATADFVYKVLRACYDQIGSLTRIVRTLSEAFQHTLDLSRSEGGGRLTVLSGMIDKILGFAENYSERQDPHEIAFYRQVHQIFHDFRSISRLSEYLLLDGIHVENFADYLVQLANLYKHLPKMRVSVLERLIKVHSSSPIEAACCHVKCASTIQGERKWMDDTEESDKLFQGVVFHLWAAGELFAAAQIPERSLEIMEQLVDLYRKERMFAAVGNCLKRMVIINENICQFASGKDVRLFGTYYRVGFYGKQFAALNGKEFVYKEPPITQLNEIKERLLDYFAPIVKQKGAKSLEIFPDSRTIEASEIEEKIPKIQLTKIEPFSELDESNRDNPAYMHEQDVYALHANLDIFTFLMPFTLAGRARGSTSEQYMRRTLLYTSGVFPGLRKRLPVKKRVEHVLSPIECACDEMCRRNRILYKEANPRSGQVSFKMLTQVLAGSVIPTVHGGAKEIINSFLTPETSPKWDAKLVIELRGNMQKFMELSHNAIEVYNANCVESKDSDNLFKDQLLSGYVKLLKEIEKYVFINGVPRHMRTFSRTSN
eukprot:927188_1